MKNNDEKKNEKSDDVIRDTTPVLTLGQVELEAPTATAVAVDEAKLAVPDKVDATIKPVTVQDYKLTEAEQKMVDDFAKKIDITDSSIVLSYGAAAQKNISGFSENALSSVRAKDLGGVGDSLNKLISELKGFEPEQKKGIMGFFQRRKNDLEVFKANYDSTAANIDRIVGELEQHEITLMKDIAMLDKLYDLNEQYFRELTMYIIAGHTALERAKNEELQALYDKAQASGLPEDAQAYNDYINICNRFEKRLHDLELTRVVSLQMAPQTRMIQNNDALVLEKIQSSISNTIPLWKSQIVLALGIENSRQATAAVGAVTDLTNNLLKKNADTLKMGTIEVAKESERSIVSIEALKHANEQLITSIDEVMRIQQEGTQKRKEAEVELGRIEGELKQKLLSLKSADTEVKK